MSIAPGVIILAALGVATVWSAYSVLQARRRRLASLQWWAEILSYCGHRVR